MAKRSSWTGPPPIFFGPALAVAATGGVVRAGPECPRAQTFLRALGIEIAFGREGRAGSRVIWMHTTVANTVSTVSSVLDLFNLFVRASADDYLLVRPIF
jgi:hypothetical protein